MALKPRQPVPALELDTLGGGRSKPAEQKPQNFSMILIYRGLPGLPQVHQRVERAHCGIQQAQRVHPRGEHRYKGARRTSEDAVGPAESDYRYGVSIDTARQWGRYISTSRGMTSAGVEEPPLFAEPGLFLVKPDATLYWASYSTMPFARPHFNEILGAIDFVLSKNYPARGEA